MPKFLFRAIRNKATGFPLVLLFVSFIVTGQESISLDDYKRAVSFMYENYHNKKAFNLHVRPNWFSDSSGVWHINQSPENKKYLKVTFPDLEKTDLFNHEKLAALLSDSLGTEVKANNLPITNITYTSPSELVISI